MKRKITVLLLSLLLLSALCVPATAAMEYGAIYDETEELGSVELTYQGEQTLPQLTESLGIDLRVDVFTDEGVEDSSVSDIAGYVYENSGYGCGEKRDGVSLTLLLRGTEDGAYTLSETDWCVCTLLDAARGSAQELSDVVRDAVSPYMVQRAWNGEDMTMSATALSQAVNAMAESVENYIRENASPDVTGGARRTRRRPRRPRSQSARSRTHRPCGTYSTSPAASHPIAGRSWRHARRRSPRATAAAFMSPSWTIIRCTAKEATSTRGPIGSTTISSSAWGMGVTA